MTQDPVLPIDALRGMRVGVSVSESPDLGALGLIERHLRLALGEIARSVLLLGGRLVYGGHLQPDGYTSFLAFELKRYGRRDRPLTLVVPWSEHRNVSNDVLNGWINDLGLYGTLIPLDPFGRPTTVEARLHGDASTEQQVDADSLTQLRRFLTTKTDFRVFIGGKRSGFAGHFPGVLEEAITALRSHQPVFFAGGFGGITLDAIRVLRPQDALWAPPLSSSEDPRVQEGLVVLADVASSGLPSNGLSELENRRLAATHRASDIAALVSVGIGRLAVTGNRPPS